MRQLGPVKLKECYHFVLKVTARNPRGQSPHFVGTISVLSDD